MTDYPPVSPYETAPRYTTLDAVKSRLGIDASDTTRDLELTEAIVAAEYALDIELGRSFVIDAPDAPIIPAAIIAAATQTSIAVWKEADAPTGSAGSDSFLGAIEVADTARRIVTRSVTLRGFKVGAGFGVA